MKSMTKAASTEFVSIQTRELTMPGTIDREVYTRHTTVYWREEGLVVEEKLYADVIALGDPRVRWVSPLLVSI